MSSYLPIMAALSRLEADEIHLQESQFLLEKGKVPHGVIMVMSGKVELLSDPKTPEIAQASGRRIWAVKEVWTETPFPFWLRANPGVVARVIPRSSFLQILRDEPQVRLEVMRLLSKELGTVGGLVTA